MGDKAYESFAVLKCHTHISNGLRSGVTESINASFLGQITISPQYSLSCYFTNGLTRKLKVHPIQVSHLGTEFSPNTILNVDI